MNDYRDIIFLTVLLGAMLWCAGFGVRGLCLAGVIGVSAAIMYDFIIELLTIVVAGPDRTAWFRLAVLASLFTIINYLISVM
jgi:hypothetical protein